MDELGQKQLLNEWDSEGSVKESVILGIISFVGFLVIYYIFFNLDEYTTKKILGN